MAGLKYAVHAYAWTAHWSNETLSILDRAKRLGFDVLEVPLMEPDAVDPTAIKKRANAVGIDVCCSTACSAETDITSDDPAIRAAGVSYLKRCVDLTAEMGGSVFSGVVYSAIGGRLDGFPTDEHWNRSAAALSDVARHAAKLGVTIGIEPVNRYETFLVNTAEQAIKLAGMIAESNVAVHLDAYHMNIEETDFYTPTLAAIPHLCHFHMSESHRGTPGAGTVDWEAIYRALADGGYSGLVGLESFVEGSPAMRAATCIWRPLAESSDRLLADGLAYLRALERVMYNRV
ncbi:MAG: sugar phosphate isomerase/epimerase [Spirochaetaceae bacterium]|nr:MAG: sugar phosphate isomerase/epimerase [Spirochaetaceae bacterium]